MDHKGSPLRRAVTLQTPQYLIRRGSISVVHLRNSSVDSWDNLSEGFDRAGAKLPKCNKLKPFRDNIGI